MEKSDETSLLDEKKDVLATVASKFTCVRSLQFVKFTYILHLNALTDSDACM